MSRELVETDRFDVVSDDGRELTVIEYTTMIYTRLLSGETSTTKGTKELVSSRGGHLNYVDENTVKDLNGVVYRREG